MEKKKLVGNDIVRRPTASQPPPNPTPRPTPLEPRPLPPPDPKPAPPLEPRHTPPPEPRQGPETTPLPPRPRPATIQKPPEQNRAPRRKKSRRPLIIIAIIAVVLIVAGVFIFRALTTDNSMEGQLKRYATNIYKKELKGVTSASYTLNLTYLETKGYDISKFYEHYCDKTTTNVILNIDEKGKISAITPKLNCTEEETE